MKYNSTYQDFWQWFETKEKEFFNVLKNAVDVDDVEENLLEPILFKLKALNENFFLLAGLSEKSVAQMIITVNGKIKDIVFAEELIAAAPHFENWKFTALKPGIDINTLSVTLGDYIFDREHIYFYSIDDENYPDKIDLIFVHKDLNDENKNLVINGTFLFVDNYLGELSFITQIDKFRFSSINDSDQELVPIGKLKDFLSWREREFIEKYEDAKFESNEDSYSLIEKTLENGFSLLATMNIDLLQWDQKGSHPWISVLRIEFKGDEQSGLPDDKDLKMFKLIEDEIMLELKADEGNLNLGKETGYNVREIFFVSKGFRNISKVLANTANKYKNYKITFKIYKDKYWQSFERYGIH